MSHFLFAARPLLFDSLGVLLFAALLAMGVPLVWAAASGVLLVVGQVGWQLAQRKAVAALQWLSLVLVISGTAASLITNDARFLMAKPSVIYAIVGVVMLKRGWMLRYVPPIAVGKVTDVMTVFGFIWAGLMFVSAALNAVVAVAYPQDWPAFVAVYPLASKISLFAVQFVTVRAIARRRIRAELALTSAAA